MRGAKERLKAEIEQFPLPYRQDITATLELTTSQEEERSLLKRLKACQEGGGMPVPRRKIGAKERFGIFMQAWRGHLIRKEGKK